MRCLITNLTYRCLVKIFPNVFAFPFLMERYLCQNPERAKIYSEHTRRDFEHRKTYFASTSIIFQKEITLEQTKTYSVCTNRPLRSLAPPILLSLNISRSARTGLVSPLAQLGTHVTNVPQNQPIRDLAEVRPDWLFALQLDRWLL